MTRAKIAQDNVTWHQLPGVCIAHMRIASFSKGVSEDLQHSLVDIRQRGLCGIIFINM